MTASNLSDGSVVEGARRYPRRPTLLPNLKEKLDVSPTERDRDFCSLFSTQQRPYVFVSDAWAALATYHRPFCESCDQRMDRIPRRARSVQISWRSRCFCRSMSVSPLRISIRLSFLRPALAQHLPRYHFFCFVFSILELFFSR